MAVAAEVVDRRASRGAFNGFRRRGARQRDSWRRRDGSGRKDAQERASTWRGQLWGSASSRAALAAWWGTVRSATSLCASCAARAVRRRCCAGRWAVQRAQSDGMGWAAASGATSIPARGARGGGREQGRARVDGSREKEREERRKREKRKEKIKKGKRRRKEKEEREEKRESGGRLDSR